MIKSHQGKYKEAIWKQYSLQELGGWVHLFAKRSSHRSDEAKKHKDLQDARNYWAMMGAMLDELGAPPVEE